MEITIKKNAKGELSVWEGPLTTGTLTTGETIEQIFSMLNIQPRTAYPMHTPKDWAKGWRERYKGKKETTT